MKNILQNKKYLINEKGQKIGVLLDLRTYSKIEDFYEDFVLGVKMKDAKKTKSFSLKKAFKKLSINKSGS